MIGASGCAAAAARTVRGAAEVPGELLPAGVVMVPPTSEDQDSNGGPGDTADGDKGHSDKKDQGAKVKKEKGKIQNSDQSFSRDNAI